ncbi:MAG: hypothetical protein AB7N76_30875 [Planctomycetota bacterium]
MTHPTYERLPLHRTWFNLREVSDRPRHHFRVWFHEVEACDAQVTVSDLEELAALPPIPTGFGAAEPPREVPPVPDGLRELAAAIAARIQAEHPEARRIQTGYGGYARDLLVDELIPVQREPSPPLQERLWRRTTHHLLLGEGDELLWGEGPIMLAAEGYLDDHDAPPRLIDYRLPPKLEGTSLFYAQGTGLARYAGCWRDLEAALVHAARAVLAGAHSDPLEALLAADGEGLLPPGYHSTVELELSVYDRAPGGVSRRPALRFSLPAALTGAAEAEWRDPGLDLAVEARLSLAPLALRLRVTHRGEVREAEATFEHAPPLLCDESRAALLLETHVDFPSLERESPRRLRFELPAGGPIDVYPGWSLRLPWALD